MDDNKMTSSKSRRKSSKAPPQIANFFSKPLSPSNEMLPPSLLPISPNERKRKLSEQEASTQNEKLTSYAKTLEKDAAKISKVQKTKKFGTLVSTFFQKANNDDLSDFESPRKKIQFKTPPVIPKKKVTRKRKLPTKQSKTKNDAQTEMFEKVLRHHSSADGMSSDDLQLALALSRSLAETNGSDGGESLFNVSSTIRNADPSQKENIIRQTLDKFGFKRRDNSDYDYRDFFANCGSKRKWSLKFTPLTRRSDHIQKLKFNTKVKNILRLTEAFENLNSDATGEYSITSAYLQQFFTPNRPSYNISSAVTEPKVEEFYVNNLVPISRVSCGSLLKCWADIPGRDVSPQRAISGSCNVDGIVISPDQKEGSLNSEVGTIAEPNSHGEVVGSCDVLESYSSNVDHQGESSVDIVMKIDPTNERPPSPDMFADYESSANNSLNSDVSEIHDAVVGCSSMSKESPCGSSDNYVDCERPIVHSQISENHENCGSQKSANVIPDDHKEKDAIVLSSDDSNQGCMNVPESILITSQQQVATVSSTIRKQLSFTDRLELYNLDPALLGASDDDCKSSLIDQSSQDSIVISDDEINYSIDHCKGDKEPSAVGTMLSQESIVLSDSEDAENGMDVQSVDDEVEERQSFSSIELHNENECGIGLAVNASDEVFTPNQSLNDEDVINFSVRELCPKEIVFGPLNSSKTSNIYVTKSPSIDVASQESILLSDSDDMNRSASQLPVDDEMDERQSFASIDLQDDQDLASENGRDINIDDEIYNSNQSLNDEDLINLSVREMYQKEFVSGSAKSSSSFSRTRSDLTFERKVWKPPKTPTNFSDNEFDEFDKLVRGNRRSRSPVPNVNSIEISDDELDKSLRTLQDSVHHEDVSIPELPTSPMEPNEFVVQSMDQIYQVRTGKLVSPKPNYENMDSPTRLEHLKKYGLKTLSKRKAVICLEHIYNRLHPFIELDARDDLDNIFSQKDRLAIDSGKSRTDEIATSNSTTTKPRTETNFDIRQENEDVFYLPSAPRAKKPWCLEPLHIAWHNLIDSNSMLYDAILQYKPVDIMDIRSLFKSIDLRYETNDIISFLDRKCITFKTDNKRYVAEKKS